MKNEPLVIERTFNAPADKVWRAITDREQMKQWYFDIPGFKPEKGLEFAYPVKKLDRDFVHLFKIIDVIVEKKISYTWRYEGEEGNSLVTFELFPEGNKTRLKLTHEGLETFPPIEQFARQNFVAGWEQLIGKSLAKFLE